MPYTTDSTNLPDSVKVLSDDKRSQWVSIWNSAHKRCQESDGDDCEGTAFRMANGVVFDERAIFAPPAKCGLDAPISARGVRLLVEAEGGVGKWARKLTRKLKLNKEQAMELSEVTKTVKGKQRPAGDFLVIGDPAEVSTWHLPVKVDGKVDRRLMGAAKAALTSPGGYRGQKYDGPDKSKATTKLKAMYKTEDMAWSSTAKESLGEMGDVAMMAYAPSGATSFADLRAVEHASIAAAEIRGLTYQFQTLVDNVLADPLIVDKVAAIENLADEFVALVRKELDEAVEEKSQTNVIVDSAISLADGVTGEQLGKIVTGVLGAPTESDDIQDAALAVEVARDATEADLSEAGIQAAENGRRAPVVVNFRILQPGPGNKRDGRYYPADIVRRDIHVFEGADVFATDHKATERNERTKVGQVLQCPASFTENGAPIAPVLIYDPAQAEKARNRNDAGALNTLECSIFGKGRAKVGEIDGQEYKIVEAITEGTFLELVSKAGAGGQAQSLQESHGGDQMKDKLETVQAETETVQADAEPTQVVEVDIEEKDVEKDAEKVKESTTEPVAETKPATETEPVAEVEPTITMLESDTVAVVLNETNLPQAFRRALAVAEYADADALQGAIDEAITEVKTISGSGQPFAQGVSEPIEPERLSEAELAEQSTDEFNKIMVDIGLPVRS